MTTTTTMLLDLDYRNAKRLFHVRGELRYRYVGRLDHIISLPHGMKLSDLAGKVVDVEVIEHPDYILIRPVRITGKSARTKLSARLRLWHGIA